MIGSRVGAAGQRTVPLAALHPFLDNGRLSGTRRKGGRRGLMRLSWNEVRARAAAFAEDWKDAAYEKGETQSFYNAFFDVFGVRRRNVARYEAHVAEARRPLGLHRPVLAGRADRRTEERWA